jgi:hypothetical protein
MTRIIRRLLFIPIVVSAIACAQKQSNKIDTTDSTYFFDPVKIGALNGAKNLSINARFGECGEWGGHLETIIVSADKNNNFYANYKVYPFNCDSLDYYYANDTLNPIVDKNIILSNDNKNSIVSFIQRMIKSKVTERFPGHAGNYFSIINSDSSLRIEVYDTKEFDVNSYRQLIAEIIN